ncbi:hypothetical protein EDD21DRAFT_361382 [Dissophora ornata]|nr:hypothetical protein EDD21DRAFT_361382 [Dissophora ornata]
MRQARMVAPLFASMLGLLEGPKLSLPFLSQEASEPPLRQPSDPRVSLPGRIHPTLLRATHSTTPLFRRFCRI